MYVYDIIENTNKGLRAFDSFINASLHKIYTVNIDLHKYMINTSIYISNSKVVQCETDDNNNKTIQPRTNVMIYLQRCEDLPHIMKAASTFYTYKNTRNIKIEFPPPLLPGWITLERGNKIVNHYSRYRRVEISPMEVVCQFKEKYNLTFDKYITVQPNNKSNIIYISADSLKFQQNLEFEWI